MDDLGQKEKQKECSGDFPGAVQGDLGFSGCPHGFAFEFPWRDEEGAGNPPEAGAGLRDTAVPLISFAVFVRLFLLSFSSGYQRLSRIDAVAPGAAVWAD